MRSMRRVSGRWCNGDLLTVADIREVLEVFPRLKGVMLGRGLLANPALALDFP